MSTYVQARLADYHCMSVSCSVVEVRGRDTALADYLCMSVSCSVVEVRGRDTALVDYHCISVSCSVVEVRGRDTAEKAIEILHRHEIRGRYMIVREVTVFKKQL